MRASPRLHRRRPRSNSNQKLKHAYRGILFLLAAHSFYLLSQLPDPQVAFWYAEMFPTKHEPFEFRFHDDWHPRNRSDRFPSVDQRVKLYMSNWYLPPCSYEDKLQHRVEKVHGWPHVFIQQNGYTKEVDSVVDADQVFYFDRDSIKDCARTIPEIEVEGALKTENRVKKRINLQSYCSEVLGLVDYMNGLDMFIPKEHRSPIPLLGQFGDNSLLAPTLPELPIISKWRAGTHELDTLVGNKTCVDGSRPLLETEMYPGLSPIIWKLEMCRHWDPLDFARRRDSPWRHKKLGALWRGDFTGHHYLAGGEEELCERNQRCKFVKMHANSPYIDAGLSDGLGILPSNEISGIPILKERVSMAQIQQYKVIISMEGNDVASGLKWSLLSESVVVMPHPTRTSWAMEELLEPWVHYIPMFSNGSNAEERIKWVGTHDEEAHKIAERGRLFMYDMLYHPDAVREEWQVKEQIAQRYRLLWQ